MPKKKSKDRRPRPGPKPDSQIPISQIRKSTTLGVSQYIQQAREFPIYGCWIMAGWKEAGLTPVVIAREQEPGRLLVANYMVDLYCLGIKDVVVKTDYSLKNFERDLPRMTNEAPEKCSVELAHEVVYGALEYAEKLGFQPHPDFTRKMADQMLDPPDAHPRVDHVVFGKDGKPFYVPGPYDDARKTRSVIDTLLRTQGEGNFNYLLISDGFLE